MQKLILQCNVLSIIFAKKTTIDRHSERPLQCYNEYVLYVCSMRPASGRQFASYQHNIWLVDDGGPVKNILLHYTARCCGAWRRLKPGLIKIWQGWHKMAAHGSGWHIMGCGHSGCSRLTFIRSHLTLLLCKTSTMGWQSLQSSSILPNTLWRTQA